MEEKIYTINVPSRMSKDPRRRIRYLHAPEELSYKPKRLMESDYPGRVKLSPLGNAIVYILIVLLSAFIIWAIASNYIDFKSPTTSENINNLDIFQMTGIQEEIPTPIDPYIVKPVGRVFTVKTFDIPDDYYSKYNSSGIKNNDTLQALNTYRVSPILATNEKDIEGQTCYMNGLPIGTQIFIANYGIYTIIGRTDDNQIIEIVCPQNVVTGYIDPYEDVYLYNPTVI